MSTFKMVRLGVKYERAWQQEPKDWNTCIAIEKLIEKESETSEVWICMWVTKGRNLVLEKQGKPLLSAGR